MTTNTNDATQAARAGAGKTGSTQTKRWTMPDGKTRAAGEGPWIASDDIGAFLDFCEANGHTTREHPDPWKLRAHQVKHQGHWMSLLWNKNFKRYTADRRLSLLVQSFAAAKGTGTQAPATADGSQS